MLLLECRILQLLHRCISLLEECFSRAKLFTQIPFVNYYSTIY